MRSFRLLFPVLTAMAVLQPLAVEAGPLVETLSTRGATPAEMRAAPLRHLPGQNTRFATPTCHLPGRSETSGTLIAYAPQAEALSRLPPRSRPGTLAIPRPPSKSLRPRLRPARLDLLEAPYPRSIAGQDALGCMALALYHEARGEGVAGQRAVASVILQRARVERWGDTVCDVVIPVQMSFVAEDLTTPLIDETKAWRRAVLLAREVLRAGPDPALKGADHYHTDAVFPSWRLPMTIVRKIGSHIFYVDPQT